MQNFLYQHQQKHYKREYIPIIDDEGNESSELVTKAMRNYSLGLQNVDKVELLQELEARLNLQESNILWSIYDFKQVERNYTSNGQQKKHFVTRKKTLTEIANETGYSVQTVRTTLKNIQKKLTQICMDNSTAPPKRHR